MIAAILALLEGPFGKLIMYAVGALFIVGSATAAYFAWEHKIKVEALLEFNANQLAVSQAENAKFKTQLDAITKNGAAIADQLSQQQAKLDAQSKSINDWLATPAAAKDDRPSSNILKETIRRMSQ